MTQCSTGAVHSSRLALTEDLEVDITGQRASLSPTCLVPLVSPVQLLLRGLALSCQHLRPSAQAPVPWDRVRVPLCWVTPFAYSPKVIPKFANDVR